MTIPEPASVALNLVQKEDKELLNDLSVMDFYNIQMPFDDPMLI